MSDEGDYSDSGDSMSDDRNYSGDDEVGDVQQDCAYNQDGVVYQHWDCNRPEEGGACYGEDGYRVECDDHDQHDDNPCDDNYNDDLEYESYDDHDDYYGNDDQDY